MQPPACCPAHTHSRPVPRCRDQVQMFGACACSHQLTAQLARIHDLCQGAQARSSFWGAMFQGEDKPAPQSVCQIHLREILQRMSLQFGPFQYQCQTHK
eukprot:1158574-Pelagomonas_calceolata.AAC.10